MVIDKYLSYIQEGYILSDKTISVDLDKFKSGENKKLLIIGMAGSGKTTIGERLAKKYGVKWISIDSLWWRIKQKFFKNEGGKDVQKKVEKKVFEVVMKYLKNNEKMIIEGIDLIIMYGRVPGAKESMLNQSMIILGLSALRSAIRAGIRNKNKEAGESGWTEFVGFMRINMKQIEPMLKAIRKHVQSMPDKKVNKYKL